MGKMLQFPLIDLSDDQMDGNSLARQQQNSHEEGSPRSPPINSEGLMNLAENHTADDDIFQFNFDANDFVRKLSDSSSSDLIDFRTSGSGSDDDGDTSDSAELTRIWKEILTSPPSPFSTPLSTSLTNIYMDDDRPLFFMEADDLEKLLDNFLLKECIPKLNSQYEAISYFKKLIGQKIFGTPDWPILETFFNV